MKEEFKQKFREEAAEFIAQLEELLLRLDQNPEDKACVNEIFRLMHSLKGSGAMFGFDRISKFTHHLESLYQKIRDDKLYPGQQITQLSLNAVDHLKALLNEQPEKELDEGLLVEQITQILGKPDQQIQQKAAISISSGELSPKIDQIEQFVWYIEFIPDEHILENGTSPLYLIDELAGMGEMICYADTSKIPAFSVLNPQACSISWRMFLCTDASESDIRDVFIFVEDDCALTIEKTEQTAFSVQKEQILEILSFGEDCLKKYIAIEKHALEQSPHEAVVEKKETLQKKNSEELDSEKKILETAFGQQISTIRVSSQKLDQLMNVVSEMVTVQARFANIADMRQDNELIALAESIQKLTRRLRENAFDICLVPLNSLLTRFRRLARDLGAALNKEVNLLTEGTDTELDKNIIQELADPIMHILRNSIDHGIESTEERIAMGKPAAGQIMIKSWYSGTNVYISLKDDGRGLDALRIRAKAIESGMITESTILSEKETWQLIMKPGFSTAKEITDVSGRGVGMDVVGRKLEELRGSLDISSEKGKGSVFTLKLPLSLSILDGLLVTIGSNNVIFPMSIIDTVYRGDDVHMSKFTEGLIHIHDAQLPFVDLPLLLCEDASNGESYVVTVKQEEKLIALKVNNVVGEHQAVLKPLGKYLRKHEVFSGATILGNGSIALVIDIDNIVKKFINKE